MFPLICIILYFLQKNELIIHLLSYKKKIFAHVKTICNFFMYMKIGEHEFLFCTLQFYHMWKFSNQFKFKNPKNAVKGIRYREH